MSATIPLFPLRTVLFPEGLLQLRIFETRYVDMVRRCLREQGVFGVVQIRDGGEVGAVGAVADVGTSARIVDFAALPDGLLGIVARGERRFRLEGRQIQRDGLHVGTVRWLDEQPAALRPDEWPELRAMLGALLDELREDYPVDERRMDDALWVSGHLGQLLPLPAGLRQRLLELDSPLERLALLDSRRAPAD